MKLSEKQRVFTQMVGRLINFAYANGVELTFGHAWRSNEEQVRLHKLGLSKTLRSKHNSKLAVDFNVFVDGRYTTKREHYEPLGEYWKLLGGRWGGDFVGFEDSGHFEYGGK